jgi:hypothetical protein
LACFFLVRQPIDCWWGLPQPFGCRPAVQFIICQRHCGEPLQQTFIRCGDRAPVQTPSEVFSAALNAASRATEYYPRFVGGRWRTLVTLDNAGRSFARMGNFIPDAHGMTPLDRLQARVARGHQNCGIPVWSYRICGRITTTKRSAIYAVGLRHFGNQRARFGRCLGCSGAIV